MTFISYAQNFEDVMLWRALKHVPAGRYIDVGAQDPLIDSVSRAFYEHGWRGIHVEPVPRYAEMLRRDRPDETVLQLALSDQAGNLELNVIENTGLSTGVKEFAESHRTRHGLAHSIVPTPMLPMKTAFASLEGQPVHWLKIDVEGLEEAVLHGWDSQALRPWIILIEATVPMSTEVRYQGTEDLLLAANYEFVYFDGLNRFYVAFEHPELKAAFSSPPNVFDEVRLSGLASSELCRGLLEAHSVEKGALELAHQTETGALKQRHRLALDTLAARIETLQSDAVEAEAAAQRRMRQLEVRALRDAQAATAKLRLSETQRQAIQHQLDAVLQSKSWQITAPIRSVGTVCQRLRSAVRDGRITSGTRRRIKSALRSCAHVLARFPLLKRGAVACFKVMPRLDRRLRSILTPSMPPTPASQMCKLRVDQVMSPAAHAVYVALKAADGRD